MLALTAIAGLSLAVAACGSGPAPNALSADKVTTTTVVASSAEASPASGAALSATKDTRTPAEQLTGAGANSAQPFLSRAFYYYGQANHGVSVNYSPAGSSVGISDIQQRTVDFGQTEIPMSSADQAKATGGAVLQVPVDLGGVAVSYNLPGVGKGLHLNGDVLASIYLGRVTHWNDPAIAALNPGRSLPSLAITPVHRADSSGPGWDLDDYLIKTSTAWVQATGTSAPSKSWPKSSVGVGQQLNTGVGSYIQQTQGAIGYVEYAYAQRGGFDSAALLNRAGSYVAPSQASIAAAGAQATDVSAANFDIVYGSGAGTYPLANFSWTLLYQRQPDADKGLTLGRLFDWVTTKGQQQAPAVGYAPLPANIVALAHRTLLQLQDSSGQALFAS